MKKRPFLNILITYAYFALVISCLANTSNQQKEFKFRVREDMGTLDWGNGEVNADIVTQLMEGLTTIDMHSQPQPALAQKWVFSDNSKTIRFTLRKDATWSDGKTVCAKDFLNAWTRALSPLFHSPFAHYLFDIRNAKKFHEGRAASTELGISAPDCETLEVRFETPAAHFPTLVSHWVFLPIRDDQVENLKTGAPFATTGPYVLTEWQRDTQFKLTRNKRYFDNEKYPNRPEVITAFVVADDHAALNLFHVRKIDWVRDLPFAEKKKLALQPEFKSFPALIVYYLSFSFSDSKPGLLSTRAPSLNKAERCALANSLNKAQIPQLFSGTEKPAASLIPENLSGVTQPTKPERTKKTTWPSENKNLEVHFYSKDIHVPLMEWIQKQWKEALGLDVKLTKMEGKSYWAFLQNSPPTVFLSGTTAAYAHPYAFLSEFLPASPANWGHFKSREFEQLSEKTKESKTSKQTTALVKQAEHLLINQECATIPLYFRSTETLVSGTWSGFEVTPTGIIYLKRLSSPLSAQMRIDLN